MLPVDPRMTTLRLPVTTMSTSYEAPLVSGLEDVDDEDHGVGRLDVAAPFAAVSVCGRNDRDDLGSDLLSNERLRESRNEAGGHAGIGRPSTPGRVERLTVAPQDTHILDRHGVRG